MIVFAENSIYIYTFNVSKKRIRKICALLRSVQFRKKKPEVTFSSPNMGVSPFPYEKCNERSGKFRQLDRKVLEGDHFEFAGMESTYVFIHMIFQIYNCYTSFTSQCEEAFDQVIDERRASLEELFGTEVWKNIKCFICNLHFIFIIDLSAN